MTQPGGVQKTRIEDGTLKACAAFAHMVKEQCAVFGRERGTYPGWALKRQFGWPCLSTVVAGSLSTELAKQLASQQQRTESEYQYTQSPTKEEPAESGGEVFCGCGPANPGALASARGKRRVASGGTDTNACPCWIIR